jgi:hypothetical protein
MGLPRPLVSASVVPMPGGGGVRLATRVFRVLEVVPVQMSRDA